MSYPTVQPGWGIRSKATGWVYPLARTQQGAEFLRVNTGAPDKYEVVQHVGDGWAARPCATTVTPDPKLAGGKPIALFGNDAEVVRLVVRLTDPTYGVEVPPPNMTAAEIRQRAEER